MPRKGRDLTGLTFGRWKVSDFIRRDGNRFWRCTCECGTERLVLTGHLTSGCSRSCGCMPRKRSGLPRNVKTHGQARVGAVTRTFRIWKKMRARCSNPNNEFFHRYGGRGITISERWNTFAQFRQDMGDCPPGMSIERIDNDGNYEWSNCRWATPAEQSRNTSSNVRLTLNGVTRCISEWAAVTGIHYSTIRARLHYGWSDERTLTEPVDHRKSHH